MKRTLTVLLVLLPGAARACAVCGAATARDDQSAFILTTTVLSLLPLVMIGAGLWWLGRQARVRLEGEFAEREHPVAAIVRVGGAAAPVAGAGDR